MRKKKNLTKFRTTEKVILYVKGNLMKSTGGRKTKSGHQRSGSPLRELQKAQREHKPAVADVPEPQARIEVKYWEETCQRILPMLCERLGNPSVPLDTAANRRYALEDLCAKICERDYDYEALKAKYEALQAKHKKCKKKLVRLGRVCDELNGEIKHNRDVMEAHMVEVRSREQSLMERKLEHLEDLLERQIEEQRQLLQERNAPSPRAKKPGKKGKTDKPPNLEEYTEKTPEPRHRRAGPRKHGR